MSETGATIKSWLTSVISDQLLKIEIKLPQFCPFHRICQRGKPETEMQLLFPFPLHFSVWQSGEKTCVILWLWFCLGNVNSVLIFKRISVTDQAFSSYEHSNRFLRLRQISLSKSIFATLKQISVPEHWIHVFQTKNHARLFSFLSAAMRNRTGTASVPVRFRSGSCAVPAGSKVSCRGIFRQIHPRLGGSKLIYLSGCFFDEK